MSTQRKSDNLLKLRRIWRRMKAVGRQSGGGELIIKKINK